MMNKNHSNQILLLLAVLGLLAVAIISDDLLTAVYAAAAAVLLVITASIDPLIVMPFVLPVMPIIAYSTTDQAVSGWAVAAYEVWLIVLLVIWELLRIKRTKRWED